MDFKTQTDKKLYSTLCGFFTLGITIFQIERVINRAQTGEAKLTPLVAKDRFQNVRKNPRAISQSHRQPSESI